MPGNPLISQGTVNLVITAVQFDSFPEFNISASYLAKRMVQLRLDGPVTMYHETATGGVTSPQPYQKATATCGLLKSQALGASFKAQLETLSLLGDFTIYPDTTVPGYIYPITNGAIETAEPGQFDGVDVEWVLTLGGFYIINQSLFS
jgi:hypothetical protein